MKREKKKWEEEKDRRYEEDGEVFGGEMKMEIRIRIFLEKSKARI